jgi:predicted acylesterase/phospholipase RssA
MNRQQYFVYRNPKTDQLWDPRTGDLLYRVASDARRANLRRIIRRQLIWLAICLAASIPAFFL